MTMTTTEPEKKTKTARYRAQQANAHGPCPAGSCKHPPIDHRPIAGPLKQHLCYHCMATCTPTPPRGIKIR